MAPLRLIAGPLSAPAPVLLERDEPLNALSQALDSTRERGRLAAISGEAGIGKTSLIEEFARRERTRGDFFRGGCDALGTPSPLAPLVDIAAELGGQTASHLGASVSRQQLFAAFLDDLSHRTRPTVVIIEDVHWADEATLDLLKYVGRRIDRTRALIVITWREDEIDLDHPIRRVLGEWRHDATLRIELRPLSIDAVSQLAGRDRDALRLHALTGGNPFFVTEVLGAGDQSVPVTVRDAVLARRASLDQDARAVVDLVSIVPSRVEFALIDAALDPSTGAVDACMAAGLLQADAHALTFRHELARLAVAGSLPPPRARHFHRLVLDALLAEPDRSAVLARIVHHAEGCGETDVILEHAPLAARQASALGAHRQAVEHYRRAVAECGGTDDEAKAQLFESYAYELYVTGDMTAARVAQREALTRWTDLDVPLAIGRNMRALSRLAWFVGDRADAERYANEAIEVLQALPETHELAMAYSNRSQLDMLIRNVEGCVAWGTLAMDLARRCGWTDVLCHSLNNVGTVQENVALIQESLDLAVQDGLDEHAARAFTNLATTEINRRNYAGGHVWLERGLAYTTERDIDALGSYLQAWRARLHAETGRWPDACQDAEAVLARSRAAPATTKIAALAALALVHLRRGDSDARGLIDQALALARRTREPQRLIPVLTLRAEFALLSGFPAEVADCACEAGDRFRGDEQEWLDYLQWRAGTPRAGSADGMGPTASLIRGQWEEAAARWAAVGCPYERGLALLEGDLAAATRALDIFRQLGAAPAARWAQERLRQLGAGRMPRGRRSSTRAHPAGLTARESEILAMLARGFGNPEIAERLFVSRKTIEHHVSSILGKLGVPSRNEAVDRARREGWIS